MEEKLEESLNVWEFEGANMEIIKKLAKRNISYIEEKEGSHVSSSTTQDPRDHESTIRTNNNHSSRSRSNSSSSSRLLGEGAAKQEEEAVLANDGSSSEIPIVSATPPPLLPRNRVSAPVVHPVAPPLPPTPPPPLLSESTNNGLMGSTSTTTTTTAAAAAAAGPSNFPGSKRASIGRIKPALLARSNSSRGGEEKPLVSMKAAALPASLRHYKTQPVSISAFPPDEDEMKQPHRPRSVVSSPRVKLPRHGGDSGTTNHHSTSLKQQHPEHHGNKHEERPSKPRRPRGMSLSGSQARRSRDSYEHLKQIGKGRYGDVFQARDPISGDVVAMKKVRLDDEQEGFPVTSIREVKFLSQADHPNIVSLKEVVMSSPSESTRNKGSVFMVFEYVHSDLVGLTKEHGLNESHVMCILKQLLEALHYAHTNHVLHRDVKPSNILVTNRGVLKLADWGLSRSCLKERNLTNRVVTLWYRAPELLLGHQQYNYAIDMWSVGCVMAELLGRRPLLPGTSEVDQLRLIYELCGTPKPEDIPEGLENSEILQPFRDAAKEAEMPMRFAYMRPSARDLVEKLLALDPKKRITAAEALDHEYFWGSDGITPCAPDCLPGPREEGKHEFEIREEEKQARAQASQQPHHEPPTQVKKVG